MEVLYHKGCISRLYCTIHADNARVINGTHSAVHIMPGFVLFELDDSTSLCVTLFKQGVCIESDDQLAIVGSSVINTTPKIGASISSGIIVSTCFGIDPDLLLTVGNFLYILIVLPLILYSFSP